MSVTVARTLDEVEALRADWATLSFGGRDADLDLFLSVAGTRPEVLRPHVIVARDADGAVTGILAARLEASELVARFGYATVARPRVRSLTVVSGGAAGSTIAELELVDALLDALRAGEADVVGFHRAVAGSSLHQLATRRLPGVWREPWARPEPHHVFDLPDEPAALKAALPRSVRDNLGRYSRRLARTYDGRMEIRRFDDAADADRLIADLEAIAATTYQRGLGAGFHAERDAELVRLGLDAGWYRAWVLSLDGEPAAFELGMVHEGSFVLGAKGYRPEHGQLHVGKAVQLRVLEDLCADPDVRVYDFGPGDADYKAKLATRSWEDVDVLLFGRTRRALIAAATRVGVGGADRLTRRVAGEERVARVKRRWRTLRTPAQAGA